MRPLDQLSGGPCVLSSIGHPLTFLWTCDDCSSQIVMIPRRALFSLLAQRLNPGSLGRAHLVTPKRKGCPCQPSYPPTSSCALLSTFAVESPSRLSPEQLQAASDAKLLFTVAGAPQHDLQPHPETAKRIPAILKALRDAGVTPEQRGPQLLQLHEPLPATEEEVACVHQSEYVQRVRETAADAKPGEPTVVADFDDPDGFTYVHQSSFADALQASGSALTLVDAVVAASAQHRQNLTAVAQGKRRPDAAVPSGFSIGRPPGHHATATEPLGFCLFNNVAIAARYAQQKHGLNKVMVLDWDVHHGNGTSDLFYDDDSVLFIDMHQDGVWPGSGKLQETGTGRGEGFTLNIPLPNAAGCVEQLPVTLLSSSVGDSGMAMPVGSGDAAAKLAFNKIIQPAAQKFQPNIILVSSGFDAHWRDPLESLNFQSSTYHWLARRIKELSNKLCGGRLVVLLEGGYSLRGLSESVTESFLGLLGDESLHPPDTEVVEPMDAVWQRVHDIRRLHGLEQGSH